MPESYITKLHNTYMLVQLKKKRSSTITGPIGTQQLKFPAAYYRSLPCHLHGWNEWGLTDSHQCHGKRPSGRNVSGGVGSTRMVLAAPSTAITPRCYYADRYPIVCFGHTSSEAIIITHAPKTGFKIRKPSNMAIPKEYPTTHMLELNINLVYLGGRYFVAQ